MGVRGIGPSFPLSGLTPFFSTFPLPHLLDGATGWYMGTVQAFGVGAAWKQPDATHIVIYKQAETKSKELVGRVACKLTAESYGASEWWLLLEPQV